MSVRMTGAQAAKVAELTRGWSTVQEATLSVGSEIYGYDLALTIHGDFLGYLRPDGTIVTPKRRRAEQDVADIDRKAAENVREGVAAEAGDMSTSDGLGA